MDNEIEGSLVTPTQDDESQNSRVEDMQLELDLKL